MTDAPATPIKRYATASDYVSLMKPRIMMLVVFTAAAGLVAAAGVTGTPIHPLMAAIALLAVALGSGAAGAINMWFDSDIDAIMTRTSTRPIPSGAVPREEALTMGLIMSGVAVMLMWLASNWLAAALLAFSIFYYGVIYTMWLKRSTPQNIVIGGGAGAFPPVIGWAAVTGNTPLDAWILFAIIFFWTPPHFWALALFMKSDYDEAGVPMLTVTHGRRVTRNHILAYTVLLVPVSLALGFTSIGGPVYLAAAILLNALFLHGAWTIWRRDEAAAEADGYASEKTVFKHSLYYLFGLFVALLIDATLGTAPMSLLALWGV
jgi:protoheme IX farnesyltransferase